jgi:hypothetical protein
MEDTTNTYKIFVAKCEGDSINKIHGISLNNNIRECCKEMGCDGVDWVGLGLVKGPLKSSCKHCLMIPL